MAELVGATAVRTGLGFAEARGGRSVDTPVGDPARGRALLSGITTADSRARVQQLQHDSQLARESICLHRDQERRFLIPGGISCVALSCPRHSRLRKADQLDSKR